ncbi:alpha/beta hydrolase [Brochothrix thermosphacta]|uniref:alpha/beta hydrolase n=1 Tax=Brochothrix thermosphacta TaxID=2756 RepID=UPI0039AF14DF
MKKLVLVALSILLIVGNTVVFTANANAATSEKTTDNFEIKTLAERKELPKNEQALINNIEDYLENEIEGELTLTRSGKPTTKAINYLTDTLAELAFEITTKRDNPTIKVADFFGFLGKIQQSKWFEGLTNKSDRYLTVYDETTHSNIKLHAFYIDNKSDKTALVHHGYRSNPINVMKEAQFLSDEGYNVLIPDSRASGASEGTYITFGAYEKNDLNAWLLQEQAKKSQQKFVLMGVSMGAATVMMSQDVISPTLDIEAIIEDCGYATISDQAHDVMRILTSRLQYIPIVNLVDWYAYEDRLVNNLNEKYVKPILKVDLFDISPLKAVEHSSVPKLFIHGTSDGFIPPKAKDELYEAASGYKEQLEVVGAAHAQNLAVGGQAYKDKVRHFLKTAALIKPLLATLAPTENLLLNTDLKINDSKTGISNWQTSGDGKNYKATTVSKNSKNNEIEFATDISNYSTYRGAISKMNNGGIRFYTQSAGIGAYLKQEILAVSGEEYQLSFNTLNPNPLEWSESQNRYGIGTAMKEETQKTTGKVAQSLAVKATKTGELSVFFGAKMTVYNLLGRTYTQMYYHDISVVNTDVTPPAQIKITSTSFHRNTINISGKAEPNTTVRLMTPTKEQLIEVHSDDNGFFKLSTNVSLNQPILHLINSDVKGNTSKSMVVTVTE